MRTHEHRTPHPCHYWLAYVAAHGATPELASLRAHVDQLVELLDATPRTGRLTLAA